MFEHQPASAGTITITITGEKNHDHQTDSYFHRLTERRAWASLVRPDSPKSLNKRFVKRFHTYWTVAGHRIREQVSNDADLAAFLRNNLPNYQGEAIVLYRGENLDRWNRREIGLCWTSKAEVAEMFGRGLNATGSGGVLLKCTAHSNAVIAGPSSHSIYLGEHEFTVDPSCLADIIEVQHYPSSH